MFGIDMGPSSAEKGQYGALSQGSGFATGLGEKDLQASSDFMNAMLGGDASKISQVLAPQINNAKVSAGQQIKTGTQFGSRSGGTAASTSATNDKVHSDITDLIGKATSGAVEGLGSEGGGLLSAGLQGSSAAFGEAKTMHDQTAAQFDDLFKSITSTAASALGAIPAGAGSAADVTGNVLAGAS